MRMQKWRVFAFVVSIVLVKPTNGIRGGSSVTTKAQYPFEVSIRIWPESQNNCGGTILDENYILTAASCVYGWYEQDLRVFVGSNRLSEQTQYEIASYKVHESYDVQGKNNDIAIVKTAQPIQMVDNAVRAVTLSNADPSQGTQAGMIGWGSPTEDPGNFKNELQELIGEVQDRNDCDPDGFTETVTDKQICTMQNGLGQGACRGDNGGPLLVDGEQVGIISFFKTTIYDGECGNGLPVVHTLVGAYADWIEQNRNF